MRKILFVAIGAVLIGLLARDPGLFDAFTPRPAPDEGTIAEAFANRQSDRQVTGRGTVRRILPDDTSGRRHQKFILELASGQTLLVAHNIDIAPRIDDLREGDTVSFFGVYAWNPRGGVIHWTHHDPDGRHVDGWLQHNGIIYQ